MPERKGIMILQLPQTLPLDLGWSLATEQDDRIWLARTWDTACFNAAVDPGSRIGVLILEYLEAFEARGGEALEAAALA